jgi:hypothetical protein
MKKTIPVPVRWQRLVDDAVAEGARRRARWAAEHAVEQALWRAQEKIEREKMLALLRKHQSP